MNFYRLAIYKRIGMERIPCHRFVVAIVVVVVIIIIMVVAVIVVIRRGYYCLYSHIELNSIIFMLEIIFT